MKLLLRKIELDFKTSTKRNGLTDVKQALRKRSTGLKLTLKMEFKS